MDKILVQIVYMNVTPPVAAKWNIIISLFLFRYASGELIVWRVYDHADDEDQFAGQALHRFTPPSSVSVSILARPQAFHLPFLYWISALKFF